MSAAIELKAPRIIAIEDRGKQYLLTLARITRKQWLTYFDAIVSTSENQGGKRIDSFDSSAARLDLVESALITASGYGLPAGKTSIDQVEGWKALLPISHRLGVANALLSVSFSEPTDEDAISLGEESVYLDAVWGADENAELRKFTGLRHNFTTPTAQQQRHLARENSRSRIIGGSRGGKTLWLGAQATLAELYDELIVSVEGYAVDGEEPDRGAIVEFMDTYHKVCAADTLFAAAAPKVAEDGD
jgi:hypothetical protein